MLILAFDTSGFSGSVALLDGPRLLGQKALDPARRSAQTLALGIAEVLASQQVEPTQIGLVATTIGPGSFTGLRVGVTTAKTIAYAAGADVLGVNTLEAIAYGVPVELLCKESSEIHAVLDAQRRELFLARFRSESRTVTGVNEGDLPRLLRLEPDRIVAAGDWLAALPAGTTVTGGGLARIESQLPATVTAVPRELREPTAAVVGRLAWRDYQAGRRDDLWKLAPIYLRPSYAEEKIAGTKPGPG